ncbi:hypothetical protein RND81_11G195100 [Saponaria officinalis]|uniref:Glycosyltransferase n=1 Tax=Saponaria officinalis TaxID=3572 RepID=A0AAW1HPQ4_SAPOF
MNMSELVFIPTPGMGHILSTIKLAKLILHTNPLISISVHVIRHAYQSSKVTAYVDSQSRDNPYPTRLTFLTFPPPSSNPPDPSPHSSFLYAMELHKPLVKRTIQDRVRAGLPKPVGLVLDMFCTTMIDVANELDIPSYIFYTSGANNLSLIFYALSLADDRGINIATEFSDPGFSSLVPGFRNLVTSDVIPRVFQCKETVDEMLLNPTRKFKEAKGILVNSFVELESLPIQALMKYSDDKKMPRVYPVGPILELDDSRGGSDNKEKESVMRAMRWLDGQPGSSVVFLCFGSIGSFYEEQVKEIANGLERSGHRFLWALRKPPPLEGKSMAPIGNEAFLEALPEGFVERLRKRGKCIGWAPQVEVLAHPAIGGFVSHCGWNSTLESLWFGVPMATWPMYAEQQLNAFELVKELGLAVEIRMDYKMDRMGRNGNFLVTADEIEKGVKNLMSMDDNMRAKIKKMSDEGKKALEVGGSSYKWLERFIEDVLSNVA